MMYFRNEGGRSATTWIDLRRQHKYTWFGCIVIPAKYFEWFGCFVIPPTYLNNVKHFCGGITFAVHPVLD